MRAEQLVEERLRAAIDPAWRLYPNVRWTGAERPGAPPRDGEADIVLVHPEHGLLVIETKAGTPARDAQGRWFMGGIVLDRSPFEQAMTSKHELVRRLTTLPDWQAHVHPRAGHAVALPSVDLASLPRGHTLLGPEAEMRTSCSTRRRWRPRRRPNAGSTRSAPGGGPTARAGMPSGRWGCASWKASWRRRSICAAS